MASCKWHIYVPWNYAILLTFDDITLEDKCCACDFVNVWETLANGSAVLLGSVCDSSSPPIRSNGNNVTVVFQADASLTGKGFKARYQAIAVAGKPKLRQGLCVSLKFLSLSFAIRVNLLHL